jgi:hypothetical protein
VAIIEAINYYVKNRNFKLIWVDNGLLWNNNWDIRLDLYRKSLIRYGWSIVGRLLKFGGRNEMEG